MPFLLLFQAILCYVPRIVWRSLNVKSGLDLVNLVDAAIKYESVDKFTDREKIMSYIIKNIERYIGARKSRYERLYGQQSCDSHHNKLLNENPALRRNTHKLININMDSDTAGCCKQICHKIRLVLSTVCFWTGKRLGNYLVVLYMFVKTLWLTNAISQLFLLNRFIGNDYHAFGVEIIEMLLSGQEWHEMRHFPRVTYCDFKIREIGNSHDWTVQCVLRINLFNEVIYIFMWFWLCILAVCSFIDFLTWTFRLIMPSDKLRFVKRHLDIYNYYSPASNESKNIKRNRADYEYVDVQKEKALMREFTFKYLKDDGIFAMRILASSASDLIATEVISELWKNFRQGCDYSDQETLASSSSLHSSHESSGSSSSAASSPSSATVVTQMGTLKKNAANVPSSSPSIIVKKPFGYNLDNFQPSQIYSNANRQPSSVPISQSGNFVAKHSPIEAEMPAPPVPSSNMPQLNNSNNNKAEESTKRNQIGFVPRHIHSEHSNANPNAKDTHV